ncbi:hypothetical protein PFISCL1PPCAC_14474, partial [Pristionchus fissidentatus]
ILSTSHLFRLPIIMIRRFLVLAALVSDAASYVYTCNEMKDKLIPERTLINAKQACVIVPEGADGFPPPEPYSHYLFYTYIVDTGLGLDYPLDAFNENAGRYCKNGVGPWAVVLPQISIDKIVCDSGDEHSEIILIFTTDEFDENIVRANTEPKTKTYEKGTHTFVAVEGGLIIENISIAPKNKETTLQFFTGAGATPE